MQTSLCVIVPVYNEQYLVEDSLTRLTVLGASPLLHRIKVVVVDDGSIDKTAQSIEHFQNTVASEEQGKLEWRFCRHETNRGKGAAIRTGLLEADTDLTVTHDADLEYHPGDLLKMIPLFEQEGADAVFGSRFLPGEFRRVLLYRHSIGNRLITFLCNCVSDLNLSDMETCYKMVRTDLLKSIPLSSLDFRIEAELTIKLAKRGARIFEMPIRYSGRGYAEGKKINWKDGLLAVLGIFRYAISDRIHVEDEPGSQILTRLNRAPRFTKWMADTVRPYVGDQVLEIGAGTGNLTESLIPRSTYWATDVNLVYLSDQRSLSQNRPYLRVGYTDVTNLESFPLGQQFDTVIGMNVIEHVEDDAGALRNIRRALRDDGRAIILVPQGPGLYGSLDEALGHFRRYTEEQLIAVGQQAGFRIVRLLRFNRAGVPAWWLNGRVLRRRSFGLIQIKTLNLLTPLFRLLEPWLPLPPLSLIAVFEKAAEAETGKTGVPAHG
jgi:glycosyltransferase involved in cell wall biosynthesis/phospholipid N-methyltransferase